MLKKIILLLLLVFNAMVMNAQCVQSGKVVLMNSHNRALPGIQILAFNATPTVSDKKGEFTISFSKYQQGTMINFTIDSRKYEVVNEKEVQTYKFSKNIVHTIVLCKKGTIEKMKRKYYHIGQTHYEKQYVKKIDELNRLKKKQKISIEEYNATIDELQKKKQEYENKLNEYADKFARINEDDISKLDREAINLVKKGKIEEAIKLYESSNILDNFNDNVNKKNEADSNINRYIPDVIQLRDLYDKSGNKTKADTINFYINKTQKK